jgi:hypothetical protein
MVFTTVAEFDSEFDKLLKKYRSLKEDIEVLKAVLLKIPSRIRTYYIQDTGSWY